MVNVATGAAGARPLPIAGDRVRVIYIMGYGHSGSTILDAMLAEADGVEGIGELASLSMPGWRDNEKEICACGARVRECSFWDAVCRGWLTRTGEKDFTRLAALRGHLRRWRARRSGHRWSPEAEPAFADFGRLVRALYQSIAETSGRRVIVDSSKSFGRARFLSRIPELDLRVIHLVRDSRAVAWSLLRKKTPALRTAIAWRFHNRVCDEVRKAMPADRTCLVRYEDLVFRTADTLRKIERCVDVDLGSVLGRVNRSEPIRFRHEVGGNHVRRKGVAHLRPDVAWTRNMPRRSQRLVWLLNRKMLRGYGYDWRRLDP